MFPYLITYNLGLFEKYFLKVMYLFLDTGEILMAIKCIFLFTAVK